MEKNISPAASPEGDSGDSRMETRRDDVEKDGALHALLITLADASATFKQMQSHPDDSDPLLGTEDARRAVQTSR